MALNTLWERRAGIFDPPSEVLKGLTCVSLVVLKEEEGDSNVDVAVMCDAMVQ